MFFRKHMFLFTLYFLWFSSMLFLYTWFLFVLGFEHVNIPICRVGIRKPSKWSIQDFSCYNLLYLPLCCNLYICFCIDGCCLLVNVGPLFLFLSFPFPNGCFFFYLCLTRFQYLVAPNLSNGEGIWIAIVQYLIFPPSHCDASTFQKNIAQIMCKNLIHKYILHIVLLVHST
jgi:hypothetical protein